jgi:hypothetical protein
MVTEVYRQCDTLYRTIDAARRMMEEDPNPSHHHAPHSEVHMRIEQKSTCITNVTQLWHRRRRCA